MKNPPAVIDILSQPQIKFVDARGHELRVGRKHPDRWFCAVLTCDADDTNRAFIWGFDVNDNSCLLAFEVYDDE